MGWSINIAKNIAKPADRHDAAVTGARSRRRRRFEA
jgi:hypothetical protein